MAHFDHLQIASKNPEASARELAWLLGAADPVTEGQDNDMWRVDLEGRGFVLFTQVQGVVPFCHVAFRLDGPQWSAALDRLRDRGIPFGNDPENPGNGQTSDPLGGQGRVYWLDRDGHLLEIAC